ncbi:hypothetical protein NPIL_153931, partial [Nephila pilipes]
SGVHCGEVGRVFILVSSGSPAPPRYCFAPFILLLLLTFLLWVWV